MQKSCKTCQPFHLGSSVEPAAQTNAAATPVVSPLDVFFAAYEDEEE